LLICGENCGFLWSLLVISFFGGPDKVPSPTVVCQWSEELWMTKLLPHFHAKFRRSSLPGMHWAQIFMEGGWWIWEFLAGNVLFLSFFWSFSVLASILQRTYMRNSIQVYTILSFNCHTIAAENLASIISLI